MADIINLRQARKNKVRAEKERTAQSNRSRFGRTKAEKQQDAFEADKLKRHLDGHKRDAADLSAMDPARSNDAADQDDRG